MKFSRTPQEPRRPRPRRTAEVLVQTGDQEEGGFNLHRDVSRAFVERFVNRPPEHGMYKNFALQGSHAVVMYPDLREKLSLNNEVKEGIKTELHEMLTLFKNDSSLANAAELAMSFRLLFHEGPDPEDKDIQELREWFTTSLARFRSEEQWHAWCTIAMALSVLYPEERNTLNVDNQAWQGVKKYCTTHRDDVHTFIPMIALIAFLFPDRKDEVNIQQQDWERIQATIERHRIIPSTYIRYAKDAYVSSLARFDITPEGEVTATPKTSNIPQPTRMPQRPRL